MQLMPTPAVQRAEDKYFGRHQVVEHAPETDPLTPDEADFIASRDSFYMASVSETGWPYVQHRGGPVGFVKVLGPSLIGFADFKGNRQLVSTGNLDGTDRVALMMTTQTARGQAARPRPCARREHSELVEHSPPSRCEKTMVVSDSDRLLRLELPAIHHAPLHGRGSREIRCAAQGPYCRVGSKARRGKESELEASMFV